MGMGLGAGEPRWRGEHSGRNEGTQTTRGLSPLARGTLGARQLHIDGDRFIPAGAGNT